MQKVNKQSTKFQMAVMAGLLLFIPCFSSCKKFVTVEVPLNRTSAGNAFSDDGTAVAVLNSLYSSMSGLEPTYTGKISALSLFPGLSADEWTLYSGVSDFRLNAYYHNALSVNTGGEEFWREIYPYLYNCNGAIEGLSQTSSLTPAVQKQLMGEAKFMRAFFYFYLVNLYGPIPLAVTTNYQENAVLPRTPQSAVYQQIITDLTEAQNLLSLAYIAGDGKTTTEEKLRPNKWTAIALLARAYLYTEEFAKAEVQANAIIDSAGLYKLDTLNGVFLKNSPEALWQLQPVNFGWNTEEGRRFILQSTGPSEGQPVYLSHHLLNSFEPGDWRTTHWINHVTVTGNTYYYPFKYKSAKQGDPVTEYMMMFRLGEQYLIRAEARAHQGKIAGAKADLNAIRSRAGLPATTASTQGDLLTAILHERHVELFTELGQRWFDLKRTGTVDAVMSVVTPQKGGTWSTNWQWYPIPLHDINKNPSLTGQQNAGY